ncbi:MAG: hypothetical protein OEL76_04665 [Siculibacillus sp.]|nr:hypothetical protein [Siculibacillus sp.]
MDHEMLDTSKSSRIEDAERARRRLFSEVLGFCVELRFLRFRYLYRMYSPDQPRVPAGNPDGGQWTDGDPTGEDTVIDEPLDDDFAEALIDLIGGPNRRQTPTVRVGGREVEVTPGQAVRLEVATAQARAAEAAVREFDPTWRPRASLTETVEGEIAAAEARRSEAEARLMELGGGYRAPLDTARCLAPGGLRLGWREPGAGRGIETVDRVSFDRILSELLVGAREVQSPANYNGRSFLRSDGARFGVRWSNSNGPTIDFADDWFFPSWRINKVHLK